VHGLSRPIGAAFFFSWLPHGLSKTRLLLADHYRVFVPFDRRYADCARARWALPGTRPTHDSANQNCLKELLCAFNEELQVPPLGGFGMIGAKFLWSLIRQWLSQALASGVRQQSASATAQQIAVLLRESLVRQQHAVDLGPALRVFQSSRQRHVWVNAHSSGWPSRMPGQKNTV